MFGDELPYRKGDNLKHMSLNQKNKNKSNGNAAERAETGHSLEDTDEHQSVKAVL